MRLLLFSVLSLILTIGASEAQSISDNLPAGSTGYAPYEPPAAPPPTPAAPVAATPAPNPTVAAAGVDPYTVIDVNSDVTADSVGHARDQALMQAERTAFGQLCARLNVPDTAAKLDDDTLASLVQSFEVQSERLSAVRYIGVFTIRFKPAALQKRLGKSMTPTSEVSSNPNSVDDAKVLPSGPITRLSVSVQTDTLASWTQMKRRITAVPSVSRVDVIDLGRGLSHIQVSFAGSVSDLQQALTAQGLVLRQSQTGWDLYDGSMVSR